MKQLKYHWHYAENETQNYYDAIVGNDYLLVFQNKGQPYYTAMIRRGDEDFRVIYNKTVNDRRRRIEGKPKADPGDLRVCALLSSPDPEYMMRKVEHCYAYHKQEVRA